ncbi:hypothetical protein DFP74_3783 [Nocardiopsis sp. Huas11]|uniref:hypothetical protein n=1 Tax=Nocardiopsis sp. Huas11 TaxID=2183912 RepID=UPI000EB1F606|nr:hypothetical protein [Nocardiopsis sp. Huas11]RKS08093.1 hypothetical protein DFP74_3783 [Nocardiopsis sp. Huas11]
MSEVMRAAALTLGSAVLATALTSPPAHAQEPAAVEAAACSFYANSPYKSASKTVAARAGSSGCPNNWSFDVYLESSRWWGWARDSHVRWVGSSSRTLSAGCAGTHDHRLRIIGNNGAWTSGKTSSTVTLTC